MGNTDTMAPAEDSPVIHRPESDLAPSQDSQTAAEFINSQLQLEADAREALPYKFDTCTRPLGPLRQLLFSCLTCNPPPANSSDPYNPAAVCYSCSVSCHGEHTLVELFHKRDFVCDCGTTRLPRTAPCTLRTNAKTGRKGVIGETPEEKNQYNHNFHNRFCGCECDYDAAQEVGTMYQCMGLGTAKDGGCGEDWWHPTCLVGLDTTWYEDQIKEKTTAIPTIPQNGHQPTAPTEDNGSESGSDDGAPTPPGFPQDDDFCAIICYKCVEANPWIKRYAGTNGFLQPVFKRSAAPSPEAKLKINDTGEHELNEEKQSEVIVDDQNGHAKPKTAAELITAPIATSTKRKAEDDGTEGGDGSKRARGGNIDPESKLVSSNVTGNLSDTDDKVVSNTGEKSICKAKQLPDPPKGTFSLFLKEDFRDHLCRCSDCFPNLVKHLQLMEEEETYEPPVSEDGDDGPGSTVGSGSLLDRGERALSNLDRVKAIEGVMAFNNLKEKLTPFFKEFAESGKAISAEDIKAHFAKMRGDEAAIKEAGDAAASGGADQRRKQGGY